MSIIFGKQPIIESLKAGRRKFAAIFYCNAQFDSEIETLAKQKRIQIKKTDPNHITKLALTDKHQGLCAEVSDYPYVEVMDMANKATSSLILMCDSLQDPQNFGTLCRSAHCFGVSGIIIPKDRSVEVNATVCKASAGAVEHMLISRVTNLARTLPDLKEMGYWCYGADVSGDTPLSRIDPAKKSVVVLGNEGEGIRRLVLENCDVRFKIEMKGSFDSLNVAQAGSIILYSFSQKIG